MRERGRECVVDIVLSLSSSSCHRRLAHYCVIIVPSSQGGWYEGGGGERERRDLLDIFCVCVSVVIGRAPLLG